MAIKAFVLIVTQTPKTQEVLVQVRRVPGVREAYEVMGPYDIVAVVEGEELVDVSSVLSNHLRRIDGVESTLTCVTMPS